MKKVVLYTALSMDGFIAGSNDELDWLFSDQDYGYNAFYAGIDTLLWGNTTWKVAKNLPEFSIDSQKRNYIFSRQPQSSNNSAVEYITGDIPSFVKNLKQEHGMDIWLVGGGQVNHILLENDLIDELVLSYHPVILGKGKPLFQGEGKMHVFKIRNVETFKSGLIQVSLAKN